VSGVELAACPFCGASAISADAHDGSYFVGCARLCGVVLRGFKTANDAAAAWNRRAVPMEAVAWREKADEPRINEIGNLWLASDSRGRVFPGVLVGHRIPDEAVKVMLIPLPLALIPQAEETVK
jgi:hypothetical protein